MRILILGGIGEYTDILYNALKNEFEIEAVITENPVSKICFIKNRIRRLGIVRVIGQLLFQVIIVPILRKKSVGRIRDLKVQYGLDDRIDYRNTEIYHHVDSINDNDSIELIKRINPQIVIVNGTRIISKKVLHATDAVFINMHMGITPKYRGVHGAYWAYYENDDENAGVTIHLVDEGIDTGGIMYQKCINCNSDDNFVTYPYHQLAIGIELEKLAINDIMKERIEIKANNLESVLRYHPTITQYIVARIKRNVK